MLKRVITWSVVIFAAFYLATQPASALALIDHAAHGFQSAGRTLSNFVQRL